jgi:hypothetical protein
LLDVVNSGVDSTDTDPNAATKKLSCKCLDLKSMGESGGKHEGLAVALLWHVSLLNNASKLGLNREINWFRRQ